MLQKVIKSDQTFKSTAKQREISSGDDRAHEPDVKMKVVYCLLKDFEALLSLAV